MIHAEISYGAVVNCDVDNFTEIVLALVRPRAIHESLTQYRRDCEKDSQNREEMKYIPGCSRPSDHLKPSIQPLQWIMDVQTTHIAFVQD